MSRSLFLCLAGAAALAAPAALACGPFFPISYAEPTVVDGTFTNRDFRIWSGYTIRINVRHEFDLLGRHFFPEWAGRELRHVPCTNEQAHRADLAAAAEAAGLPPDEAAARVEALLAFAADAEERCKTGEKVELPDGLRDFEREFYLYALGRAQRLADKMLPEPPAWLELLALPPERRPFRTVWARHGLVLAAPDIAAADRRLRELRADLDAGFRDTCGLEEAIVMQLLRRGPNATRLHWLPLAATVRGSSRIKDALVADADWLRRKKAWGLETDGEQEPTATDLLRAGAEAIEAAAEAAVADPLTAEVLVTLGLEDLLPETMRGKVPVLCADRRAWVAFEEGDFERGRKLLALAPKNSLVRLFWEARLARIDGDYARSTELLREWLAEAVARGGVPEGVFEVHDWDEGWHSDSDAEDEPRTRSFERVVQGELGAVLLTEGDFEEALLAFLRARSWIDAAFVAERCMTVDALAAFVRNVPSEAVDWGRYSRQPTETRAVDLRWLVARRFLREGRIAEAGEFFPEARRPEWELYARLVAEARPQDPLPDPVAPDDARALAFFNLGRLLFVRGMELVGTELEPDVHAENGAFSFSGIGDRTVADLPHAKPLPAPLPPLPEERFHYRQLATEAARRAAALASDPDVRVASLLLEWQIARITHGSDPEELVPAYRALCAIPDHPVAEATRNARWFPAAESEPLLGRLEDERNDYVKKPVATPFSAAELRALLRGQGD